MRHISPVRAISVYVISWKENEDSSTLQERRVHIGVFDESVSTEEIHKKITENNLWFKYLTAYSLAEGKGKIISNRTLVSDGIIFDSADEFVKYANNNVSYEDIVEGYRNHVEI